MTSEDKLSPSDFLSNLVGQAKQGDANAGRLLLEVLHISLRHEVTLRPDLRDYFATAVHRMMKGDDPKRALNLVRPRGRQKGQVDLDLVRRDQQIFALFQLRRDLGDTYEEAVASCEEVFILSESTVRRAVDKHLKLLDTPPHPLLQLIKMPE